MKNWTIDKDFNTQYGVDELTFRMYEQQKPTFKLYCTAQTGEMIRDRLIELLGLPEALRL